MKNIAPTPGPCHAVTFHDTDASLALTVAGYVIEGFSLRQPALLIATEEQRVAILTELRRRYIDVDRAQTTGGILMLDAADVLSRVMVDALPDRVRFTTVMTDAIQHVLRGRTDCRVRAFGTMANGLWRAGNRVAAIRLETLWNVLVASHDFPLLCAYAQKSVTDASKVGAIVDQHSHARVFDKDRWIMHGSCCPACGTAIPPDADTANERWLQRCPFCSVLLIHVAGVSAGGRPQE